MQDTKDSIADRSVELGPIIDAWQRDLEALVEANKAACENLRALSQRQRDELTEAMQGVMASHADTAADDQPADLARDLWVNALTEMKTHCEDAFRSQTDAMTRISGSTTRHLQAIQSLLQRRASSR